MAETAAEAFLATTTTLAGVTSNTQSLSAAAPAQLAARLASSVVLLDPRSLQPQQAFSHSTPAAAATTLLGVALSPSGAHVAAYTADQLLLAQCDTSNSSPSAVGQLQPAAHVPSGIRSVHFSPCGAVLAVCCKTQPEVMLFALQPPAHDQQSRVKLVLTLRGPDRVARGPSAATWVPAAVAGSNSSTSIQGLLVAWPLQLLLFTWHVPAAAGGIHWGSYCTHDILTAWPGAPKALLALEPAAAGAAANDGVRVVALVDADTRWHAAHSSDAVQTAPAAESPAAAAAVAANGVSDAASAEAVIRPGGSSSIGSSSDGGVLGSLMNISGHQQQGQEQGSTSSRLVQQLTTTPAPADSSTVAGGSSSMTASQQHAGSYLCLLTLNLPWLAAAAGAAAGSSSHTTAQSLSAAQQPQSYVSVLPLLEQPLARYLAAAAGPSSLVAVGSSTGAPRVTLCAVSDTAGLQTLQTVALPLPRAVMEGAEEGGSSTSSSQEKQARLQGLVALAGGDVVALVACSDKPSAVFGGGGGASADLYLLRVGRGGRDEEAKAQQQPQQQPQQQLARGVSEGGESAVVAALRALQASLESRLDAMQATLSSMDARLAALERKR